MSTRLVITGLAHGGDALGVLTHQGLAEPGAVADADHVPHLVAEGLPQRGEAVGDPAHQPPRPPPSPYLTRSRT